MVMGTPRWYIVDVQPATGQSNQREEVPMNALQILGIGLSGVIAGAGLLLLLIGMISNTQGDELGSGCLAVGLLMIGIATYAAVRIIAA